MFGQPEPLFGFIMAMSFYSSASLAANPMLAVSACRLSLSWLSSIQKLVVLSGMSEVIIETDKNIQTAKDFLWDNLPEHTKEIIILEATTDVLERNGLELQEFVVSERYKR